MRENVREGYVAPHLFCFCFFSPFPVLVQQLPCHGGDNDACTGRDMLAQQHRPSEAAETGIFSTLSLTTSPQDVICPLHGTTKWASERRKTATRPWCKSFHNFFFGSFSLIPGPVLCTGRRSEITPHEV